MNTLKPPENWTTILEDACLTAYAVVQECRIACALELMVSETIA